MLKFASDKGSQLKRKYFYFRQLERLNTKLLLKSNRSFLINNSPDVTDHHSIKFKQNIFSPPVA